MHMRRSLALVSGALLLTAPLAGCGMNEATERINTITAGTNARDAGVDVLNAIIVSAEEGSGTFIATFVNNDTTEDASVESLESADPAAAQVADFSPIRLDPGQLVNLADSEEGVIVEGVSAGGMVRMTLQLSGGELVELDVPVVPSCDEYAGLDASTTTSSSDQCEIAHAEGAH